MSKLQKSIGDKIMINIKVTYNGKPFNEADFTNDIMKAAVKKAQEHIKNKLNSVVCPIHGKHLDKVIITVDSKEKLSVKMEGCCDQLLQTAKKSLA